MQINDRHLIHAKDISLLVTALTAISLVVSFFIYVGKLYALPIKLENRISQIETLQGKTDPVIAQLVINDAVFKENLIAIKEALDRMEKRYDNHYGVRR
jgi:hypothetical protein